MQIVATADLFCSSTADEGLECGVRINFLNDVELTGHRCDIRARVPQSNGFDVENNFRGPCSERRGSDQRRSHTASALAVGSSVGWDQWQITVPHWPGL